MKNRIKYNCKRCEKEFLAKRNRKNVTWCSKNCRSLDEKGKIFSKEHRERLSKALIGKKKSPQHIRNIVISRGDRTGERASNWKGGITKISICIRSSKNTKNGESRYSNWMIGLANGVALEAVKERKYFFMYIT